MDGKKTILVVLRDRKAEALRVSAGLLGCDDQVEVFVLDEELEKTEQIALHLRLLEEFEVKLYSNNTKNSLEYLTLEALAHRLPNYDLVIPY
ncbi:MAG: hypothetical protein HY644_06475 [Acidobacteria bacterium]|nr:hypothetical protein [Acidobacteriota bacterium]